MGAISQSFERADRVDFKAVSSAALGALERLADSTRVETHSTDTL